MLLIFIEQKNRKIRKKEEAGIDFFFKLKII